MKKSVRRRFVEMERMAARAVSLASL